MRKRSWVSTCQLVLEFADEVRLLRRRTRFTQGENLIPSSDKVEEKKPPWISSSTPNDGSCSMSMESASESGGVNIQAVSWWISRVFRTRSGINNSANLLVIK